MRGSTSRSVTARPILRPIVRRFAAAIDDQIGMNVLMRPSSSNGAGCDRSRWCPADSSSFAVSSTAATHSGAAGSLVPGRVVMIPMRSGAGSVLTWVA